MESYIQEILSHPEWSKEQILARMAEGAEESEREKEEISKGDLSSHKYDKDRKILYDECVNDYDPFVWSKLSEKSKTDLKNGYFYSELVKQIEDDESTPLMKFTKTVEVEIREKLFLKFIKPYIYKGLEAYDDTDDIVANAVKEFRKKEKLPLTLGQMLIIVKASSNPNTDSNYAESLYHYFKDNNWDTRRLYSKETKDKNFYIFYPDKYRNDSAHSYVNDPKFTKECKKDTIEILTWFIKSAFKE